MRNVIIVLLISAACLAAADAGPGLRVNIRSHRALFLGKKIPGKFPPCITGKGTFKLTGAGDLFSRMMDTWGSGLFTAKKFGDFTVLLPVIETWAREEEEKFLKTAQALSGIYSKIEKSTKGIKRITVFGEFTYACSGNRDEVLGMIIRLIDLDRWIILNCRWLAEHIKHIRENEEIFRKDWAKRGVFGIVIGPSLIQRIYDIAEIQLMFEDMSLLDDNEKKLYRTYKSGPYRLGPAQRMFYAALVKNIPEEGAAVLQELFQRKYEISYLNAQFARYADSDKGADLCAEKLGEAVTNLFSIQESVSHDDMAEVINFRQTSLYSGINPGSRFAETVASIDAPGTERQRIAVAKKAAQSVHAFYKANLKYGPTFDIADSLEKKKADGARLCNYTGIILANRGYSGLYPVQLKGKAFLGMLDTDGRLLCYDILSGRFLMPVFPDWFKNKGTGSVELYVRSIGGWVSFRALVDPAKPLVQIDVPYVRKTIIK